VLLYCICGAAGQVCPALVAWRRRVCSSRLNPLRILPQNFIFMAISSYGSLVNITITTTRKARAHRRAVFALCLLGRFRLPRPPTTDARRVLGWLALQFFNVLLSVFYNKSYLQAGQWSGVVLVFVGLGACACCRCAAAQCRA
jgi:hypothetical protein